MSVSRLTLLLLILPSNVDSENVAVASIAKVREQVRKDESEEDEEDLQ